MKLKRIWCLLALMAVFGSSVAQELEDPIYVPPVEDPELALAGDNDSVQPWEEYGKLIKERTEIRALGPTLFGDDVDLYRGGLSFTVTDVSLPGNSKLPVAITRKFTAASHKGYQTDSMMADWDLDIPSISGTFAPDWISSSATTPNNRCSVANVGAARPPIVYSGTKAYLPEDYWHGIQANMPGGGEMMLVNPAVPKPATGTYYWVTKDLTYISCLPSIRNGTGEGFQAITADGTKYTFDFMAGYVEPMFKGAKPGDPDIPRSRRVLYATRVEDRFGNWVEYSYANTQYNQPARLTAITSNDGRQITLGYNTYNQVSSVSDGTHTWTYQYVYPTGAQQSLSAVVLPDSSKWTIDFAALFRAAIRYYKGQPGLPGGGEAEPYRDCFNPGAPEDSTPIVATITHPSGAVGQFTVAITRFGRTNVPQLCSGVTTPTNDPNDDVSYYPMTWDSFALTRKQVSGPGLTAATWNYIYNSIGSFAPGIPSCSNGICPPTCVADSCAGNTTTEVTGPDSTWTRYTYGNSYRYNEGKLLKTEVGTSATDIKKAVVAGYQLAQSGQVYAATVGTSPQPRSDAFDSEYRRPERSRVTTQDGATFAWQVAGCPSLDCFDSYARPTKVVRSNSMGYTRTETTSYADNLTAWVIGQVAAVTCVAPSECTPAYAPSGIVESQTTYSATTALPYQVKSFGRLRHTLGYNADGTLATVTDGNGKTTTLSNWYRGIPRTIQYPATSESPAGAVESAEVNPLGWITSTTDETSSKTCYGYDAMGRLTSITYPSETAANVCDASKWATTNQSFAQVATIEYGIPAGHWRQLVTTGNARKFNYYDALWRPVLTLEYDAANMAGTQRFTRRQFDIDGHETFASYPGTSDALTLGTWTTYDPIDRVTKVEQDSELGSRLVTTTTYLNNASGPYTLVTNPRTQQTRTWFQMFDEPDYRRPATIWHPEGAYTDIARDVFGKPLSLTRRNSTGSVALERRYTYTQAQELCRTDEPETGANFNGYDNAGNLLWSASGYSTAQSGCLASADVAARRVDRSYDGRNRLATLSFPDGQGDQSWSYTPDGLPATVTTVNGGGNTVTNTYSYNRRRLMTQETMARNAITPWYVDYTYDANGNLSLLGYPSALSVDYAPNALGQATKAGTYASGVTYFPNGAIKQFTYGNGIVHTLTQNARGLPDTSKDAYSTTSFLNDGYDYDANGNVAAITDGATGTGQRGNRTMTYDGLDRLKTVASPMFGATGANYTYDVLDNLTRVNVGGVAARDHYYCYDTAWRLTNVKTGSCAGTSVIGLGYDPQGNLNNKNGVAYTFDYGNRLRVVSGQESYLYDAYGRRVQANKSGGSYIVSQYSQSGQLLYQQDYRKAQREEYVYLGGSLVANLETPHAAGSATVVKYQHTDALGSPVVVTDANRVVLERNEYEPYGKVIAPTSPQDGPGFTGHVFDAATGMDYMQQRYYDPTIGRFLSVDPVTANSGTGANFNRYWYASNNPYRFTDPDGRMVMDDLRRIMDSDDRPHPKVGRGCNDGHTCYGGGGSESKAWHNNSAEQPVSPHEYSGEEKICSYSLSACTPEQFKSNWGLNFSAPGQTYAAGNGVINSLPMFGAGGPKMWQVVHEVQFYAPPAGLNAPFMRTANVTLPLHVFTGRVDRYYFARSDGIYVMTIGRGGAFDAPPMNYINNSSGPALFRHVNDQMREAIEGASN